MLKLGCKRNRRQGGAIAFVITEYYERALSVYPNGGCDSQEAWNSAFRIRSH